MCAKRGALPPCSGDVQRAELAIACEISITTSPEHERGNVAKCLAVGFTHVFLIAPERKQRDTLLSALQDELDQHENLAILAPEALCERLEEREAATATREETVKGYKVKVNFRQLPDPEKTARKKALSEVLLQSLKRHRSP